jgi:Bacterial membrane flanked domain.
MWFPITFTTYEIRKKDDTDLELRVKTGLISAKEEKIKLYKINDISFNRGIMNFLFGVGNLTINSSDKSSNGLFTIKKYIKLKRFSHYWKTIRKKKEREWASYIKKLKFFDLQYK